MRLLFLLFLTFHLEAHKIYQSADELPQTHRMIWSVKQRQLATHPDFSYHPREIEIRESWTPERLSSNVHIVHGIESYVFDSVVSYYRNKPFRITNDDLVRYYLDYFFSYKQVISASLIHLSKDPFKAQQVTYTACGFILDVPPECLLTTAPRDLFSPNDAFASNNLCGSRTLLEHGAPAMRNEVSNWMRQRPLQWTPQGLLSHSYKCDERDDKLIPTYNEIVILPQNVGKRVKVKGVFINTAETELAGEIGTYEGSIIHINDIRRLAHDLDLSIIEFKTDNDIRFPSDSSVFQMRSPDKLSPFENIKMWAE